VRTPPSPHFKPVSLEGTFNARRDELPEGLRTPPCAGDALGEQVVRGMPFAFGAAGRPNVVLLDREPVTVELDGARATYVVLVHVVEDVVSNYLDGFADDEANGFGLGARVSEYELEHADGSRTVVPVVRRFAIQQARFHWGSTPFACIAAHEDGVIPSGDEAALLGRPLIEARELSSAGPGDGAAEFFGGLRDGVALLYGMNEETRARAPMTRGLLGGGCLWIYALPVAAADVPLRRLVLRPGGERSAVYAATLTDVAAHPLRWGMRRKLRLRLPAGARLNAVHELEEVGIDLGTVISARAALDYDAERWPGAEPVVEPARSTREVVVEYAAHPQARLYAGDLVHELGGPDAAGIVTIAPAQRPVRLRFADAASGAPAAVRLHLHGAAGEYLPPRGHHRLVNRAVNHDRAAEFVNVENQYAYVDGECVADLPLGTVYVEIARGYEIAPVRTVVEIGPETDELTFTLEKVLRWRERGWVTADTHVHVLSPPTALLEGRAEGVNVVNLLASQWGELFTNVGDFDGRTTYGAADLGGDGEFLVRVGSENRMHALGHISLLGYAGELIHPLSTGGPDEAAIGDPLEVTMAEWAQRCIDQGGLVVMPHAPTPQLERAADIVLGLVHAVELMTQNPLRGDHSGVSVHVNAYGLADWYRYLNLGYHVPLVGGSDKMGADMLLGGIRTYAQLGERELTYASWMDAIRAGDTFVTVGPLASLRVEGVAPGGQVRLPAGGGSVQVEWEVESVRLPIERVEVVAGGLVVEDVAVGGELAARGHAVVPAPRSSWIALRVRGSYRGLPRDVAAHTSAVQVLVEGSELFSETDSMTVLDQIQGAIAYVDTIATRPDARRFTALRATLEAAYSRLHQRMHAAGVYHRHPLHDPGQPHEH